MASTGKKRSSGILTEFITKKTQLWQYLNTSVDFFLRSVGLRTTSTFIEGLLNDYPCSITQCANETYVLDGVTYDIWRHQGSAPLLSIETVPATTWEAITELGTINVSKGVIFLINDSSLVEAPDGLSTTDRTPLANDASLVVDVAGGFSNFASLIYLTIYNDQAPITENWIRISSAAGFNYTGTLKTDFKFAVEQGATVTLTVS